MKKLSLLLTIVVLTTIAEPRAVSAQSSLLAACSQPLILFEEHRGNKDWLNCITTHGYKDLHLEGYSAEISPNKNYLVYVRSHGPMRKKGKEWFGYESLYLYNLKSGKELRLLSDMGHINYFWVRSKNLLMISFWLNTLGAYEDEYPAHFLYDPNRDQFTEMKWPDGRIAGYFPGDDKYLLFSSNLFLVSSKDGQAIPFEIPSATWYWGVHISPNGNLIAFVDDDQHTKILNQTTGKTVDLTTSKLQVKGSIQSFSNSEKYITANGSTFSLEDMQLISSDVGDSIWLEDTNGNDLQLIVKSRASNSYLTDLFLLDPTTKKLTRLTNTSTWKSIY